MSSLRARGRRELTIALLLAVAGAALALYVTTRTWWVLVTDRPEPFPALRDQITGREEVPWATALAFVTLAAVAAILATKRFARVMVAAVMVAAGIGLAVAGGAGLTPPATAQAAATQWPAGLLVSGIAVMVGGGLIVLRDRRWNAAAGLGARFDNPAAEPRDVAADSPAQLWDALDAGIDPTDSPAEERSDRAR